MPSANSAVIVGRSIDSREASRTGVTIEHLLYAAILVVAAGLRFYALGEAPLNDFEAHEALAALALAGGEHPISPPISPGYASLSALIFALFGAGNALARAIPALAGSALALTPFAFRNLLGRFPALIAALLIALSPEMAAASRGAGGGALAALGIILSIGMWLEYRRTFQQRWLIWTGVSLGLSLTSGPAALTGWLTLGLAAGLSRAFRLPGVSPAPPDRSPRPGKASLGALGVTAAAGGLTVFGLATFLTRYPGGLGAFAAQVGHWLAPAVTRPAGQFPLSLAVYEPIILLFGGWGAVRSILKGEPLGTGLTLAAVGAFLFSLLFPGRTVLDAIWVLLPLAALAGVELSGLVRLPSEGEDRLAFVAQTGILLVLFAFSSLTFVSYADQSGGSPTRAGLSLAQVSVGGLGLAAMVAFLFGLGWSWEVSQKALKTALAVALAGYGLSAHWGLNQLRRDSPWEPWNDRPVSRNLSLLVTSLREISSRHTGAPFDIDLAVLGEPVSALAWAVRDFHRAAFLEDLGPLVTTSVVITPASTDDLILGSAYLGQSFPLTVGRGEEGLLPANWPAWIVSREGITIQEHIVLWVREDVQLPEASSP